MRNRLIRTMRGHQAAFTLIELIVVVVILGLLATLIMPKIMERPEQARRVKAKVQLRNFQSALALLKVDTGRYPTTAEGLNALTADPGTPGWKKGGYLDQDKVPLDPWGHRYFYQSPGRSGHDYELTSFGKDGETGGTDDDTDIDCWNLDTE